MSATKIRRMSINMYNSADSTANTALSTSTGGTSASNDSYTSDYIAIDRTNNYTITIASSTGTITNDTSRGLCFYDANKGFISGFAWRGRTDTTYSAPLRSNNIPANTAYIRFTCDNGVSSIMLAPGLTAVPYEPYGEAVWGDGTSKKRIMSRNLFNIATGDYQESYYKDDNGVLRTYSGGGYYAEYIPVDPDTNYYLSNVVGNSNLTIRIYFYDDNKQWISRSAGYTTGFMVTTPSNCHYVQLQISASLQQDTNYMFAKSSTALPYEPYGEGVWVDCAVKKRIMSRNLFDYTTMVNNDWHGYINANNVSYGSSSWRITDYIPCDGTDFVLSKVGGNTPAICAYDANKRLITGKAYQSGGSSSKIDVFLHTSATAKFIRFSFYSDTDNPSSYIDPSTLMLSEGTAALPTEPYGEEIWV